VIDLQARLTLAVQQFWGTRHKQARKSRKRNYGTRTAVTGGAQMDGFIELVQDLLVEAGMPREAVFRGKKVELPGFYRPTKKWDLVVVADDTRLGHKSLLASLEFKSHVGSFGNNYNNRTEEALGNATDLWTAYRDGAFPTHPRPWLGYLMLLERARRSTTPLKVREPHFRAFEDFRGSSYAKRYEILCQKLVRERLYDAACLVLSDPEGGAKGEFTEPSPELTFKQFMDSLISRTVPHPKAEQPRPRG
jgi:hypothetical protein